MCFPASAGAGKSTSAENTISPERATQNKPIKIKV